MKKFFRIFGWLILIVLIIIQFFHPSKNIQAGPFPKMIANVYPLPDSVDKILKTSCTDCHSNNTNYPWYNNIQPVAWWLNNDVEAGKRALNFDEFAGYPIRKQFKRLEDINKEIKEDGMPLPSYLWIHKSSKLNEQQKLTVSNWCMAMRDSMKLKYPIDSLMRKK